MKLFHAAASPFVRKVMITAIELGLDERIELLASAAHPVRRDPRIIACNPLGKVPTLITEEGLASHRQSLANRHSALAGMLSKLSQDDLDTLARALEPLERLATFDAAGTPADGGADCPLDCG